MTSPAGSGAAPAAGGIFISHVHEDALIAAALAELVHDITAGLVPALSSSSMGDGGIRYGTEWFQWIKDGIEAAAHLVAILTPQSLGRPWILFEAGLMKARPGGNVFGLALGVDVSKASTGPFGVFQNCGADLPGMLKLCGQLLERSGLQPRAHVLESMVTDFLEKVATFEPLHDDETSGIAMGPVFQALEDIKYLIQDKGAGVAKPSAGSDFQLRRLLDTLERVDTPLGSPARLQMLGDCAIQLGLHSLGILLRYLPMLMAESRTASERTRLLTLVVDATQHSLPNSSMAHQCVAVIRRELQVWTHLTPTEQAVISERDQLSDDHLPREFENNVD